MGPMSRKRDALEVTGLAGACDSCDRMDDDLCLHDRPLLTAADVEHLEDLVAALCARCCARGVLGDGCDRGQVMS